AAVCLAPFFRCGAMLTFRGLRVLCAAPKGRGVPSGAANESASGGGLALDPYDTVDKDARRHNGLGVKLAQFHDFVYGCDGELGRGGHDGPEVASGLAIHQVAPAVAAFGLDEGDVAMDRLFEYILAAIDLAGFTIAGQFGSKTCGAKECADAGPGGAQALGQGALGDQFELDLASAIQRVEHVRIGLAGEAANDLAHL